MSFTAEKAYELIAKSRNAGRLAHAYLITGPEGSGKQALASRIIRMVNSLPESEGGLESLRSGTNTILSPQSKSRIIKIGESSNPAAGTIRAEQATLYRTAPSGVTKFMVIIDCDRMNQQASNAFLKTLEEPPRASMLLLLTASPEQLLPTILSRCLRVPLREPSGPLSLEDNTRRFLDALKSHAKSGSAGISAALGLMAQFTESLKSEKEAIAARNEAASKAEVEHYKKTTDGEWLKHREEYYKALSQSEYLEIRTRLIEFLVAWFGDALRQQNGGAHLDLPDYADATGKIAGNLTGRDLGKKIEAVEALRSQLNTNVQETLALEAAFINAFG